MTLRIRYRLLMHDVLAGMFQGLLVAGLVSLFVVFTQVLGDGHALKELGVEPYQVLLAYAFGGMVGGALSGFFLPYLTTWIRRFLATFVIITFVHFQLTWLVLPLNQRTFLNVVLVSAATSLFLSPFYAFAVTRVIRGVDRLYGSKADKANETV